MHSHRLSCCLQAGVAASRSLEEVAELEKAVCLLIQRAADIYDAKSAQLDTEMAATLAKLQPGSSDGSSLAVSLNRDHSMGEAERAVHAEASTSNVGDESADGGKTAVSATSELITPGVEKQLPRSARRVRFSFLGNLQNKHPDDNANAWGDPMRVNRMHMLLTTNLVLFCIHDGIVVMTCQLDHVK